MDEISIAITKSDGENVLFNISKIYEEMMQFFNAIDEFIEEIKDSFTEKIMNLLQEFASCMLTFRSGRSLKKSVPFIVLSLYRWSILRLTSLPLTQSYDGISKMLRRVYLIHHRRTTSVTDDPAICGIA